MDGGLTMPETNEIEQLKKQLEITQHWLDEFQGNMAAQAIRIMTLEKLLREARESLIGLEKVHGTTDRPLIADIDDALAKED
jgi:hypothetical protein